jgi:hypothetical protein
MPESKIRVLPINSRPTKPSIIVNATSRGTGWERALSPFFAGPVTLPNGQVSQNMENAWQFSKAYAQHVGCNGEILPAYWQWAKRGWSDRQAHRYPMGRGAVPLFALGADENERLDYVASRKRLYGPLYLAAVKSTAAFGELTAARDKAQSEGKDLVILDFDAYDHHALGMSLQDVIENPRRKAGHGFFLALALEGKAIPTL